MENYQRVMKMLWIINGLVYGFFSALYTMVNQDRKFNGYILGIWRGYGIALVFLPFLFFLPVQTSAYNWFLLIFQGWLIGIYDSHLFFASADFGAGPTSRVMAVTALVTTFLWWILTPHLFLSLVNNGTVFITLLLVLFGFTVSYWYMIKSPVSKAVTIYIIPAILALAGMSIATKEIAMMGQNVWANIAYYLVVATFVSGVYNTIFYIKHEKPGFREFFAAVFDRKVVDTGIYIVSFSAALIAAKTMAMRIAPNPGYVVTLLLTAPVFVYAMNKYKKVPDNVSIRAGFMMLMFVAAIMIIVSGNFGGDD